MPTQIDSWNAAKLEPISFPDDARIDAARLAPNLTLAAGTVLGKVTATSRLAAYNDSLTNGAETAVAILVYDTATDADGNCYSGGSAAPSALNLPHATAPVYVAGVFDTADLTGWDAAAKVDFHGRALPSGYIRIP